MKNDENIVVGVVVHGNGRGKTVGMPTANIDYEKVNSNINCGVYASTIVVEGNDKKYIGVTNVGTRPSVDDNDKITVETNILNFDEDIYGKKIEITLLKKIRDIKKFSSLEEVKKQVDSDKKLAEKIIIEYNN